MTEEQIILMGAYNPSTLTGEDNGTDAMVIEAICKFLTKKFGINVDFDE